MTFPLINNVYEYKGQKVIVWQQKLFIKVCLRSIPDAGGSTYFTENWWKFMINANFVEKAPEKSSAY